MDVEKKIKLKVQKLLKARFIKEIECLSWLANIVPVTKKNDQIRIYVDFRDLNKACPKDGFLFPNVDILVDAIADGFLFLNGFLKERQHEQAHQKGNQLNQGITKSYE